MDTKKCEKCGTENPSNATFCSECGESLPEVKSNPISKGMSYWKNQNKGFKILTGFLGCCIGAFIILMIIAAAFPTTNLSLANTTANIDNQTTEYLLIGHTEPNATVKLTSKSLNLNGVEITPESNGTFEYKLEIPTNTSEVDVTVTAKVPNKSENRATTTIKRPSPTTQPTANKTTTTPAELNSGAVKSIIGNGADIKSVDVKDGAVTITYDLGFVNSMADIPWQTSDDAINYMEKLFKDSRVTSVTVVSTGVFTDQYGKDQTEEAVRITINKATADKIDWNGERNMNSPTEGNLFKISDSYSIHPAVYKAMKYYIPISK